MFPLLTHIIVFGAAVAKDTDADVDDDRKERAEERRERREERDDPDEYSVECSCGESFGSWGKATRHAEEEH